MVEQDASRMRRLWNAVSSVRGRLVLTLGIFIGFGAVGTSAYWTDQVTLEASTFEVGTLDLLLGSREDGTDTYLLEGQGGKWEFTIRHLHDVAPGESVAMNLLIKNGGSTALTFDASARTSTDDLSPYLLVTTRPNASANNTGTRNAVNRTGSCSGGQSNWWTDVPLDSTARGVLPSGMPTYTLQGGEHLQVCLLVTFSAAAPSTLQGQTTTVTALFEAEQPRQP